MFIKTDKKGYLQIDFLFVLLIILFFYTTYIFSIHSDVKNLEKEMDFFLLEKKAQNICTLLVNQPGVPIGWNVSTVKLPGLKNDSSLNLSLSSVDRFFNTSNYLPIHSAFNISEIYYVKLFLVNGTELKRVGFLPESEELLAVSHCFAQYNSTFVRLEVGVWK
jgi:hypothetical protein